MNKPSMLLLFALLLATSVLSSQDSNFVKENYTKNEYQVEMRDGVKLFTIVYTPKDNSEKYPFHRAIW